MAIEIRQLVVKSNVLQRCGSDSNTYEEGRGSEEPKNQQDLDDMRRMIARALRESKER